MYEETKLHDGKPRKYIYMDPQGLDNGGTDYDRFKQHDDCKPTQGLLIQRKSYLDISVKPANKQPNQTKDKNRLKAARRAKRTNYI